MYPPYVPAGSLHHLLGNDIDFLLWQQWFAWYPVKTMSGKWTFMKTVYRRKQTVTFTRFATETIGSFANRVKLSNTIYSNGDEVILERLAGKESYYQDVRSIISNRKEGTYQLAIDTTLVQEQI